MAGKEIVSQEFNSFIGGLVTEFSPINFPPNASKDEENWVLNRDGSRERRLGFDFEENFNSVPTNTLATDSTTTAIKTYLWENAGDIANSAFVVTQVGSQIFFHNSDSESITDNTPAGILDLKNYPLNFLSANKINWSTVGGRLIGAWGSKLIITISFKSGSFILSYDSLKIRDLFSIDDIFTDKEGNVVDLNEDANISYSIPAVSFTEETYYQITDNHLYNLRNQTWGQEIQRIEGAPKVGSGRDPIAQYMVRSGSFPSNASDRNIGMVTDPANGVKLVFSDQPVKETNFGNTRAPTGYFIIDALDRGSSRLAEMNRLSVIYPKLVYTLKGSFPEDRTPGGATIVSEYAGHVFFAGFSGDVIDGDSRSPSLSSYVLFSQLVKSDTDIYKCYQDGDPTSSETSDIVATDGGFIRIPSAYNIKKMVDVGAGLLIIAENGVWMLSGGSDYGFSAENYLVRRLTTRGAASDESIVVIDNTVMYWAIDGIYMISPDNVGEYTATNISKSKIQTIYNNISEELKRSARGVFDSYSRSVKWLYTAGSDVSVNSDMLELVFDIDMGAFYKNRIFALTGSEVAPLILDSIESKSYTVGTYSETVFDDGAIVTDVGSTVVITEAIRVATLRSTKYLVVFKSGSTLSFTYGQYRNQQFLDWKSYATTPVDAKAYFITGTANLGDNQKAKNVPYITAYFKKSELGFTGDFEPINSSSCLCTFMWDWSNASNANRWSRQLQLYRHTRFYIPSDISDTYEDGYELVVTKTKIRGRGRAFSMRIDTEPLKDCQLVGWALQLTSNSQ